MMQAYARISTQPAWRLRPAAQTKSQIFLLRTVGRARCASEVGIASRRDLRPSRSLGHRRLRPQGFCRDAAEGEPALLSKASSWTHFHAQSNREPRGVSQVQSLLQPRRRIQLARQEWAKYGSAFRRTALSRP